MGRARGHNVMTSPAGGKAPRVAIAMIGARRHYAVPLTLHRLGILERFYTDAYVGKGWLKLLTLAPECCRSSNLGQLLGRRCDIPAAKVTAFNAFGFEYAWRLRRAKSNSETTATYVWAGEAFNSLVLRSGLNGASHIYAFQGAALELFQRQRSNGVHCMLDEFIVPRRIQDRILDPEYSRWGGLEFPEADASASAFIERENTEVQLADVIVAPSQFVIDGLVASGVSSGKCCLVPSAIDTSTFVADRKERRSPDNLRVLFVGAVGLRKGIPYLLQAARKLRALVTVRVVGDVICDKDRLMGMTPPNVQYLGRLPRREVYRCYDWADVFCLPSLCEGSAYVTYEALARGVPVVCTPNTGSVVRDGRDGFLVPIRNSEAIVEALERLARDPELLNDMSGNARKRAQGYGWPSYGDRLMHAICGVMGGK